MPDTTENSSLLELPAPTQPQPAQPALIPPPQNEPDSTGNPDSQTSIAEKIRRAGGAVVERAGLVFKRGRGRPRKDGAPGKLDMPITQGESAKPVAVPAPAGVAPDNVCNPPAASPRFGELFGRSVVSAIKGVLDFADGLVTKKGTQAGLEPSFVQRVMREARPEPQVLSDFSDALKIVLDKRGVSVENAPEIALGVSVIRLAAPYWLVMQTFNAEIQRRRSEGVGRVHIGEVKEMLAAAGTPPDRIAEILEKLHGKG